mmetsp:Transcript_5805/g.9937  ORF Transcript_5805/g.9937 Transcript_5805/m.9937 type:complete len:102 (+) Transcript_5805:1-306(+)
MHSEKAVRRQTEFSDITMYQKFLHPNLEQTDNEETTTNSKKESGLINFFNRIDDKYIRPIFVYKYNKRKGRFNFEIEDMLKEYKMIEEELDDLSSDEAIED